MAGSFARLYGVNAGTDTEGLDALTFLSDPSEYQASKDENAGRLKEH